MQNCLKKLSDDMQGFLGQIMSGGDASKLKDKICPVLTTFVKCAMRASSDSRPTEAEMDKLRQEVAKGSQQLQGIDCNLDFDAIADEVWSSAGVARPLSIMALAVTAMAAMFAAKRM
ncbi:hypothetical protein EGW08_014354 [Elysia chlorotica]|uniref:Uncharacterized protein n=1 Tax=Elysia chlorotica TaxID=188477 RepID=A0A3S0ZHM5_ELYCH|nr:hypothetical protein EGW08_014354 [Elysia chlorotica]